MLVPAARLLTLLELLQARERWTTGELADRLDVSERSVRHYVTQLRHLGIPVHGTPGRYGGYRLGRGYRLPPLMFTEAEGVALVTGLLAARSLGLAAEPEAGEGARTKIDRVLADGARERVRALAETLALTPAPSYPPPQSSLLGILGGAARTHHRVLLKHRAANGSTTEREVDPHGLVHHTGRWFLVAWCHLRADHRVFRLDRVVSAELTDKTFEPPPPEERADLPSLVAETLASTPGAWRVECLLRTTHERARQLVPRHLALLTPIPDGILMTCHVQRLDWIAHYLLGLDLSMDVLGPPELATELHRLADRARTLASSPHDTKAPVNGGAVEGPESRARRKERARSM